MRFVTQNLIKIIESRDAFQKDIARAEEEKWRKEEKERTEQGNSCNRVLFAE